MSSAALRFSITRGEDYNLQWDPPVGSRELADALSYHYPLKKTLQEKMQQASIEFWRSEKTSPHFSKSGDGIDPSIRPISPASPSQPAASELTRTSVKTNKISKSSTPEFAITTWNIETGETVTEKRRRRPYDQAKRRIVAENRGKACDSHRQSKTRCDPNMCPNNKLYRTPIAEQKEVESTSKRAKATQDATLYSHGKEKPPGLSRESSSGDVSIQPASRSPCDASLTEVNTTPTAYTAPLAPTGEVLLNPV